jgi:uncharacterized protein with HEPN domain
MTSHDDSFYLEGIKEHLTFIKSYIPTSKEVFMASPQVQDSILMRLLALGEEISHLSDDFVERYPGQHWHKIVGLRNRIAHGYWEVDKDVIWDTLIDEPQSLD